MSKKINLNQWNTLHERFDMYCGLLRNDYRYLFERGHSSSIQFKHLIYVVCLLVDLI